MHHREDLMSDYLFFGEAFRWQPSEVERLPWSMRREMKEVYLEVQKKRAEDMKRQR